jgi:hypothetical protein
MEPDVRLQGGGGILLSGSEVAVAVVPGSWICLCSHPL